MTIAQKICDFTRQLLVPNLSEAQLPGYCQTRFYSITRRIKLAGFYAYFFSPKKNSEWKPIYGQHCF